MRVLLASIILLPLILAGCAIQPITIQPICLGGDCSGNGSVSPKFSLGIVSDSFLTDMRLTGPAPLFVNAVLNGSGDQPVYWFISREDVSGIKTLIQKTFSALNEIQQFDLEDIGRYEIAAAYGSADGERYSEIITVLSGTTSGKSLATQWQIGKICDARLVLFDDIENPSVRSHIRYKVEVKVKAALQYIIISDEVPWRTIADPGIIFITPPIGLAIYTNTIRRVQDSFNNPLWKIHVQCVSEYKMDDLWIIQEYQTSI